MYKSKLNMKETQKAIKILKDSFEKNLAEALNLDRVSAPIIVSSKEGVNDDLGIKDREILTKIIIHHMNPITPDDIRYARDHVFDPEFLICTSSNTHNAIHFGDESLLYRLPPERKPGDTTLW